MIVAEPELTLGADHAVGHVAIGLACSDAEIAGQHRAGHGHDHQVSGREVARTADDPANSPVGFPNVDLKPTNRLPEVRQLFDAFHAPDKQRA